MQHWFAIVRRTDYASFAALRVTFPSADQVGRFTVFDIGANKFRLITAVHSNRKKVYVRHVLTHAEYDRGTWRDLSMLAEYIHEANADYRRIRRRITLGPLRTEAEYHRAVAVLDDIIDEIGRRSPSFG